LYPLSIVISDARGSLICLFDFHLGMSSSAAADSVSHSGSDKTKKKPEKRSSCLYGIRHTSTPPRNPPFKI